ncbi:MAG: N-acetylmuramoyl-L-alanine amidase, partial [Rhizobiales bacterium]|nr:N-acetylmuramoyl-L-alanine amidase [Hyphomicrobiales bacterium]
EGNQPARLVVDVVETTREAFLDVERDFRDERRVEEASQHQPVPDALAGLDLAGENADAVLDILFDLTRRETRNFEMVFAQNLVKELRGSTTMFKVPHQKAGFKVLTAHDFPSAMIELGFVSNPDDEKLLLSDDWRGKVAASVAGAVDAYFEKQLAQRGSP